MRQASEITCHVMHFLTKIRSSQMSVVEKDFSETANQGKVESIFAGNLSQ